MSGVGRSFSRANSGYVDERPRMTSSNVGGYSSKHERPEGRNGPPPSHTGSFQASLGHKRSASGNLRPISMAAAEERRYEERKVTERTYEAQIERVVPRTAGPEKIQRRSAPGDRRPADVPTQKSAEWRPRDSNSKSDVASSKLANCMMRTRYCEAPLTWSHLHSTLEPRSYITTSHDGTSGVASVNTASSVDSAQRPATGTTRRASSRRPRSRYSGRSAFCFHGI